MNAVLSYAVTYPAMLVIPAIGAGTTVYVLRIKARYIKEGMFFGRRSQENLLPSMGDSVTSSTDLSEVDANARLLAIAIDGMIARCSSYLSIAPEERHQLTETVGRARDDWRIVRSKMQDSALWETHRKSVQALDAHVDATFATAETDAVKQKRWMQSFIGDLRGFRQSLAAEQTPGRLAP
ncbi:hypothetical protein P5W99_11125 [Paraburkholderia sp. A3BS-1L]|uniref:hypothetical protein n=1 Tax=Paraburkholderia sp. A3BS-1L TaxID=3028375 RepID=UPI003DA8B8F6